MKRTLITLLLATALVAVAVPVQAGDGPNEAQTTKADPTCANPTGLLVGIIPNVYDETREQPATQWAIGHASPVGVVDVEPGTAFEIWKDDDPLPTGDTPGRVNFYNAFGEKVGTTSDGLHSNVVPSDAEWGVLCWEKDAVPQHNWRFSAPGLDTVHYQDGWDPASEDAPETA